MRTFAEKPKVTQHAAFPKATALSPSQLGYSHEVKVNSILHQTEEQRRLQTKHVDPADSGQTIAPPIVEEALANGGGSLPDGLRADMEHRFAHDFSNVRVHTHGRAAESAAAVGARAYTVGRDV